MAQGASEGGEVVSDQTVIKAPRAPVATFTDEYGDERIIHRPKGRRLSVFNGGDTPTLRMNRAVAVLLGKAVRARRNELGYTARELCMRAGFVDVNPKQRIHHIETAMRGEGVRLGTLYALAHALDCAPVDLLPSVKEAADLAGVAPDAGMSPLVVS